jgi:hypothetical protein
LPRKCPHSQYSVTFTNNPSQEDGIDRRHIPQRQLALTTPGVAGRAIRRLKGAWDSTSIKTEISDIRVSITDLEALLETIFLFL